MLTEHRHQRYYEENQPDPYPNFRRNRCKDHARDCQGDNNAESFQKSFHFDAPFRSRVIEREHPAFEQVPSGFPRLVRDEWIHHMPLGWVAATLTSDAVNEKGFAA